MLPVTSLTACALVPLFMALTVATIRRRRTAQVAVGDGGQEPLARVSRAHGNLAESMPLVLILMALAELNGTPWPFLALLGAAFVAGRAAHAYGLVVAEPDKARPNRFRYRIFGMATTLTVVGVLALTVLLAMVVPALIG